MSKKKFLNLFLLMTVFLAASGCSSNPYVPPAPQDPQAYVSITNNCSFSLYVHIDDKDGEYIGSNGQKTYAVTPGNHIFTFTGTDQDYTNNADYPLFFETQHVFQQNETYPLSVRFGINF